MSYDDACNSCTRAITECRNQLLSELVPEISETESEVCSLAIVIFIAAEKMLKSVSSVDDFYSCLPLLDGFGKYSISH